jgi:hypothetical protein
MTRRSPHHALGIDEETADLIAADAPAFNRHVFTRVLPAAGATLVLLLVVFHVAGLL